MSNLVPVPPIPLRDDPTEDAVWKRWLHELHVITAAVPTTYQPLDSDLTAIAALTTTAYGRAFLALANAAAARTALALGTAATNNTGDFDAAGLAAAAQAASQPVDSDLTAIAALTTTSFGRSFLALADASAGRTLLALGTAATHATTDYDVAGAAAAVTPTTLGLVIGTNVQAHGAKLDSVQALASAAGWLHNDGAGAFAYSTPTASNIGLGSVTNDAQTKASIVPNTAPAAGGVLAGNAGGTAYAPVTISGDGTLSSAGALAVTKSGGVSFGTAAFTASTAYAPAGAWTASTHTGTASTLAQFDGAGVAISSATLPAVTLGGTVSGGTQDLNNLGGVHGTAGSFTGGAKIGNTLTSLAGVNGLDVQSGSRIGFVVGADVSSNSRTDATIKKGSFASPHYTNAQAPVGIFNVTNGATTNVVVFGGSTESNAPTSFAFQTAANNTTLAGVVGLTLALNATLTSAPQIQLIILNTTDATSSTTGGSIHSGGISAQKAIVAGTTVRTGGFTVATLPAGAQGMRTYVTNALTPAFGVALVGGGAVVAVAFYDGTNWIDA